MTELEYISYTSHYRHTEEDKQKIRSSRKGKIFYNDGLLSFFLYPTDSKIIEFNLQRGRISRKKVGT